MFGHVTRPAEGVCVEAKTPLWPNHRTLLFRPKSQTARGWSLAIIEVLLAFCAPSVSGFPEAGYSFTPCHMLSRF